MENRKSLPEVVIEYARKNAKQDQTLYKMYLFEGIEMYDRGILKDSDLEYANACLEDAKKVVNFQDAIYLAEKALAINSREYGAIALIIEKKYSPREQIKKYNELIVDVKNDLKEYGFLTNIYIGKYTFFKRTSTYLSIIYKLAKLYIINEKPFKAIKLYKELSYLDEKNSYNQIEAYFQLLMINRRYEDILKLFPSTDTNMNMAGLVGFFINSYLLNKEKLFLEIGKVINFKNEFVLQLLQKEYLIKIPIPVFDRDTFLDAYVTIISYNDILCKIPELKIKVRRMLDEKSFNATAKEKEYYLLHYLNKEKEYFNKCLHIS